MQITLFADRLDVKMMNGLLISLKLLF